MLPSWLEPGPDNPLWLFALRLAARLSNYTLLLFALVSLATVGRPEWTVIAYLVAMVAFCLVNLRAITLVKHPPLNARPGTVKRIKNWAHLLSAALPLGYLFGVWQLGLVDTLSLQQAVAVTAPPLLNWLAIEETLKRRALSADYCD